MRDRSFSLDRRVLLLKQVTSGQITTLLMLPIPARERTLGRIAELAYRQADSFSQLDRYRAAQLAADHRMST